LEGIWRRKVGVKSGYESMLGNELVEREREDKERESTTAGLTSLR
jgi:hypothetical protein